MRSQLSRPINPTQAFICRLRRIDPVFERLIAREVSAPEEVWLQLLEEVKLPRHLRNINGCGSKSTSFIPDSIWGLSLTPLCHIHDIHYSLSTVPDDCDTANFLFLKNSVKYITSNSHWLIGWFRRFRIAKYVSGVELVGTNAYAIKRGFMT